MSTKKELEAEAKFDVNRDALPQDMGKPWVLIQAHRLKNGKDQSLRIMPACKQAYFREKDHAYGVRNKASTEIPMEQAMSMLRGPFRNNVALKYRYMLLDGRGWLIDHFPEHDALHAETEFNKPAEFWHFLNDGEKPQFVGKDITFEDQAYTRNLGKPRSSAEITHLINLAKKHGCTEKYDPDKAFAEKGRSNAPSEVRPVT